MEDFMTKSTLNNRLLQAWLSSSALGAMAVFAAGLLLAEVNMLSARHYVRIDASDGQRYTLSEPTRRIVQGLSEPVEVLVLLGSSDPLLGEMRQLLTAYQALSSQLVVKYIDPDRDTAEFLALTKKHNLGSEALAEGNIAADAALMIRRGSRTWFIRGAQMSQVDEEGTAHLRIEGRLTEGLARVGQTERSRVCFVTGHGERSIDDNAPEGLIELRRRLERSNVQTDRVPLDVPEPAQALSGCDVVAVVGSARTWPKAHSTVLLKHVKGGGQAALFLDPVVDHEGKIIDSGLGEVTRELGVIAEPAFVLETDPAHRLPNGLGEAFFAIPKTHPLTLGLSTDQARLDSRAVVVAAGPLRQAPGGEVKPVLTTSPQAVTISHLNDPDDRTTYDQPLTIAYAGEVASAAATKRRRSLVVGTSNVLTNPSFQDPALHGSRTFSESAFSWLLDTEALVSVPERPPLKAGLTLSEESLQDLLYYVLIYMPLAAASVGAFVLLRRRRREDHSHPRGEGAA
jgi:hypothetical protein